MNLIFAFLSLSHSLRVYKLMYIGNISDVELYTAIHIYKSDYSFVSLFDHHLLYFEFVYTHTLHSTAHRYVFILKLITHLEIIKFI